MTLGEVPQRHNLVDAQRNNFEVGHLFDDSEVLELVTPEVEVLDALQVVRFGLVEHQVESEHLTLAHLFK